MRWGLAAAAVSLLGVSGCLDDAVSPDRDCSTSSDQMLSAQRSTLLPDEPADTPYDEAGNKISVIAREGQDIVALAVWRASVGQAQVNFDGPSHHQVATEGSWTTTTYGVPAGEYSLEMFGAPVAFDVGFSMQLIAFGCTLR